MSANKSNLKELRQRAAAKGIFSIAELARRVGCSRPAIYFAVENPNRFPRVHQLIKQLIGK